MAILFAGTRGFLDDVSLSDVAAYEQELYQFLDTRHSAMVDRLGKEKSLDEELAAALETAVREFTEQFVAARKGAAA